MTIFSNDHKTTPTCLMTILSSVWSRLMRPRLRPEKRPERHRRTPSTSTLAQTGSRGLLGSQWSIRWTNLTREFYMHALDWFENNSSSHLISIWICLWCPWWMYFAEPNSWKHNTWLFTPRTDYCPDKPRQYFLNQKDNPFVDLISVKQEPNDIFLINHIKNQAIKWYMIF